MFETFLPLVVTSVLAFMSQPPIDRIGAYAGPYWSEGHSYNSLTRLSATVYWGGNRLTPVGKHRNRRCDQPG